MTLLQVNSERKGRKDASEEHHQARGVWRSTRHLLLEWDTNYYGMILTYRGFPGGSTSKKSTCNVGDLGSISGLGRSPGEGNGYPLQYSGLENSMDRGTWQATVHGVAKSQT